jgi:hypothetical protein
VVTTDLPVAAVVGAEVVVAGDKESVAFPRTIVPFVLILERQEGL